MKNPKIGLNLAYLLVRINLKQRFVKLKKDRFILFRSQWNILNYG